ncbi:MAG: hypothetical protein AABW80_02315 [Nanoarchaeota archaeon]
MAKKFPKTTFNEMLKQLRVVDVSEEERLFRAGVRGENMHYLHLVVTGGDPDLALSLFKSLGNVKAKYSIQSIVEDKLYRGDNPAAFILSGSQREEIEQGIARASAGLDLQYEVKEF